jgi:hypothetical protein
MLEVSESFLSFISSEPLGFPFRDHVIAGRVKLCLKAKRIRYGRQPVKPALIVGA